MLAPIFRFVGPARLRGNDEVHFWLGQHAALSLAHHGATHLAVEPQLIDGRVIDGIAVRLMLAGTTKIENQNLNNVIAARTISIIELDKVAQLIYGTPGISEITLWLPRSKLARVLSSGPAVHGRSFAGTPAANIVAGALQTLIQEVQRNGAAALDAVANGLAQLVGDMIVSAEWFAGSETDGGLQSLETIRSYIDTNLRTNDLTAAKLASVFGLSRSSLYRLFAPLGGVAAYIRARRLEVARREIKDPSVRNHRIAPVAYGVGFGSISTFNRAYAQTYRETPRESRAPAPGIPKYATSPEHKLGPLTEWLLALE